MSNFAQNLAILRKRADLSQEQLAELLHVSRQAVSKWESGQSYPDLDKVLALAQQLGCSTDELLQGTLPPEQPTVRHTVFIAYDRMQNWLSKMISFGVGCILFGVSLLLFLLFYLNNIVIPVAVLLSLIAVATVFLIIGGMQAERFRRQNPIIPDEYTPEQKDRFEKRFIVAIACGVGIILLGVVFLVVWSIIKPDLALLGVSIFMFCVTVSVVLFVYFGMQKDKYTFDPHQNLSAETQPSEAAGRICGVIMLLATAAFLVLGFVFHLWHPGWLAFPIGGILCGVVNVALSKPNES